MDFKQIGINLLVMGLVYIVFYSGSFFFSKKYAKKRKEELENGKEKNEK